MDKAIDLGMKLAMVVAGLFVLDAIFNAYMPKPIATPTRGLEIIWSSAKL